MNYDSFISRINKIGFPVAEAENKKSVKAPYVVHMKGVDSYVYAGGVPIFAKRRRIVELYTERNDTTSQSRLEEWLIRQKVAFKMSERAWLVDVNLYVTEFEVEFVEAIN